jgi:hypothetical protein
MMNAYEAHERARMLGMSVWTTEVIAATASGSEPQQLFQVGFKDIDLALAEGETWEGAFDRAMDLIFRA